MSDKQLHEVEVLSGVLRGEITQARAASLLGCCTRTIRRKLKRYQNLGPDGLQHGLKGHPSNRAHTAEDKATLLALIAEHPEYSDFGPTLLSEVLLSRHALSICISTLRRWLVEAGFWRAKPHKARKPSHAMRIRMSQIGELVQMDGSHHDWFEGRGARCCLLAIIDDATSQILAARFVESESTFGYMGLLESYFTEHGLPQAIYTDKHSTLRVNNKKQDTPYEPTQVGSMLDVLGVELIFASTPQAKGRIERLFNTLQDRLVKLMRLANISNMDAANAYLTSYIPQHNAQYAITPREPHNLHVSVDFSELDKHLFTVKTKRKVSKNGTVQYKKQLYQLNTAYLTRRSGRQAVTVCEHENGQVIIFCEQDIIDYEVLDINCNPPKAIDAKELEATRRRRVSRYKSPQNHPWRRFNIERNKRVRNNSKSSNQTGQS